MWEERYELCPCPFHVTSQRHKLVHPFPVDQADLNTYTICWGLGKCHGVFGDTMSRFGKVTLLEWCCVFVASHVEDAVDVMGSPFTCNHWGTTVRLVATCVKASSSSAACFC